MVSLTVEFCGLKLRNPLMPAAGPISRDGDALVAAAQGGAGALVANTVSMALEEVPRPFLAKVRDSMLHAEPWSDLPLERWLRLEYAKAKRTGLPLIASIGYTPEKIRELAQKVEGAGMDALELSTKYLACDPGALSEATRAAKEAVGIPVLVKLRPNVPDIVQLAVAAEGAGADGIVAIDGVGPCLAIDIETSRPMMGGQGGYGALSGPAIKPLALRCVADICRAVKIPVIGAGGISDGRDAIEFIMAGAVAVQVCTAVIVRGPKVFALMADEMVRFMRAKGYESIADFRGIALRHLPERPLYVARPPEFIASKCTICGLCEKYCVYGAIRMVGKGVKVDPVRCTGCGLCVSVCPSRALLF